MSSTLFIWEHRRLKIIQIKSTCKNKCYTGQKVQMALILTLDLSSSRIQMGALGHTLTPFCSDCRQFFGFIPGDVHVLQISTPLSCFSPPEYMTVVSSETNFPDPVPLISLIPGSSPVVSSFHWWFVRACQCWMLFAHSKFQSWWFVWPSGFHTSEL